MLNWFQLTEQNFNWNGKKAFGCKREQASLRDSEMEHTELNITQIVENEKEKANKWNAHPNTQLYSNQITIISISFIIKTERRNAMRAGEWAVKRDTHTHNYFTFVAQ